MCIEPDRGGPPVRAHRTCHVWFLHAGAAAANQPSQPYENLGDGSFRAVPDAGGAQGSTAGLGSDVTTMDFDRDGFMDLFVFNGNWESEGPNRLFRNLGNRNDWLEVDLVGTALHAGGVRPTLSIPVGTHTVRLTVTDSSGQTHTDATAVTVTRSGAGVVAPSGVTGNGGDARVIAQVSVPDSAANRRKLVDGDLADFRAAGRHPRQDGAHSVYQRPLVPGARSCLAGQPQVRHRSVDGGRQVQASLTMPSVIRKPAA